MADRAARGAVLGGVVMVAFLLGACLGAAIGHAVRPARPNEGWGYVGFTLEVGLAGGLVVSLIVARLMATALKLGRPWATVIVAAILNALIIVAALSMGSRFPSVAAFITVGLASFMFSGALAAALVSREPAWDGSRMSLRSNVDELLARQLGRDKPEPQPGPEPPAEPEADAPPAE